MHIRDMFKPTAEGSKQKLRKYRARTKKYEREISVRALEGGSRVGIFISGTIGLQNLLYMDKTHGSDCSAATSLSLPCASDLLVCV